MTDLPDRPWVLVVGMHRSGTSAIAGALAELGLQTVRPDDRMDWPQSNPEHWESLSLGLHNEGLLAEQGGSWDAPPEAGNGLAPEPGPSGPTSSAAVLAAAYPGDTPAVWKDPRLCLLLPHWREVIHAPLTVVLVWRSPWAVARSLHQRDGMSQLSGIALWEWYNRAALGGLDGAATFVIDYEKVVESPQTSLGPLLAWLTSQPPLAGAAAEWDADRATASIAAGLRHQPGGRPPEDDALLPGQQGLVDLLAGLEGGHDPLEVRLDFEESPWAAEVIRVRRQVVGTEWVLEHTRERLRSAFDELGEKQAKLEAAYRSIDAANRQIESQTRHVADLTDALDRSNQMLEEVYTSTSWKVTKPVRQSIAHLNDLRARGDRT
jgi:hypothetical protein